MNCSTSFKQLIEKGEIKRGVLERMLQVVVSIVAQTAILIVSSGRLDWLAAWAYVGVNVVVPLVNSFVILPKDPELIVERARLKDVRAWDRAIILFVTLLLFLTLIVAGLDIRYGWSPHLALVIQFLAFALVALGYGLLSWAMLSSRFFSGVVRIQKERDHTVVTAGPYHYVRHPGYAGMITALLATPILLGSVLALLPAGLATCGYVLRTALEDTTLREELDGYEDYAERVRYRLVPGLW